MYVKLHATDLMNGEILLEIGTEENRVLFDTGTGLPPSDSGVTAESIRIKGLTDGEPGFDGVFVAHPHGDCRGLLGRLLPGVPVYAGNETRRVLETVSDFSDLPCPRIRPGFLNCQPIQLGGIRVTPVGTDRGTRDAYMFLIQAEGKSVLYTGDYRAVEEVLPETRRLLGIAGSPGLMIIEAPRLCRARLPGHPPRGEAGVRCRAAEKMRLFEGTAFLLCDPTDEARVQALVQAAEQSGRLPYEDLFLAALREDALPWEAAKREYGRCFLSRPVPRESRVWPYAHRLCPEEDVPVGPEALAELPGRKAVFVRPFMLPFIERYMDARPAEEERSPILLCSLWHGCWRTAEMRRLLEFCRERHISVMDLQSEDSLALGEMVYQNSLESLFRGLRPAALLPIHCGREGQRELEPLPKFLQGNLISLDAGAHWEVP